MIKVLKGKQIKLRFLHRLLRDVTRNSLTMCLSNTLSKLVLSFHWRWTYATHDICEVAKLSILIRGIDDNFCGVDIFDKVISCLENLQVDSSQLVSVCTDGAPSMISQVAETTTLIENFINRPLLKYHCIIHQESLRGKTLN